MTLRQWIFPAALVIVAWVQPAQAQVNVVHTDALGNKWANVYDVDHLNWYEISAVCPQDGSTACAGTLNGIDVTGLIWATQEQVRTLFKELTGLDEELDGQQYIEVNSRWAPLAMALLDQPAGVTIVQGWVSAPDSGALGRMALLVDNSSPTGNDIVTIPFTASKSASNFWGTWLYSPSVAALVAAVNDLIVSGSLDGVFATPLVQLLSHVQQSIDAHNTAAARGQLQAFARQVQGLRLSGRLPADDVLTLATLIDALTSRLK